MIINNVNVYKILEELTNSNVVIVNASNTLNRLNGEYIGDLVVNFEDSTDMDLVQRIINAHDPTPIPPKKSETEILGERVEMLGMQLAMEKLSAMETNTEKDMLIDSMGAQLSQMRIDMMILKGGV